MNVYQDNKMMTYGDIEIGTDKTYMHNPYSSSISPLQVPLVYTNGFEAFFISADKSYHLPLYSNQVKAGFPSPAEDYIEKNLDLNTHLIKHPAATFLVIASGDSMINAGIHSGDTLIVDRSITPISGKIVIAAIAGELTVKRLVVADGRMLLVAENEAYPSIDITDENDLVIWGVVIHVIHSV